MPTSSSSSQPTVRIISACIVKPSPPPAPDANLRRCHLTPWDIAMLSANYIQKGLLFTNLPSSLTAHHIIPRLKTSLAAALHHFYPLAGRLVTDPQPDEGMFISIACTGEGAEFIHAIAENLAATDVLAPLSVDVPSFVRAFFPYDNAVNHDGHSLPLLAVQLTELADGVFVACSFNHVVGDGTSYWHFFNAWAEITRVAGVVDEDGYCNTVSLPPIQDRWFIDGVGEPPIKLPFSHSAGDLNTRFTPPPFRERIFYFSPESVAKLKARANEECHRSTAAAAVPTISSFQALSALMWTSITRARGLPASEKTSCRMAIQDRGRLKPPLSPDYFGNAIYAISATATAGELMDGGLGAAAMALNRAVAAHDDDTIRRLLRAWHAAPWVHGRSMFDKNSVLMGSSPKFDLYGCDFGWGKAAALRSWSANKFDGKVSSYPGREGSGSLEMEVCLLPEYMKELESDEEFMAAVSVPPGRASIF